jgi:hypothetical protein
MYADWAFRNRSSITSPQMNRWMRSYRVEHDFKPFWFIIVQAESQCMARLAVCQQFGFQYDHTDATTTGEG